MRIVAFGTASTGEGYPRMEVLLDGLERQGVEVVRVLRPLFRSHAEKLRLAGGSVAAAFHLMPRLLRTYTGLGCAYQALPAHDAVLVGALGHLDLLWLRCLPGGDRVPVVFDPFVSLHDTVVRDRGLAGPGGLRAGACLTLDRQACLLADRVLVDTDAALARFAEHLELPPTRLARVYQGQDDRVFRPEPGVPAGSPPGAAVEVLFAGTYVPLQGVETILEAAAQLRDCPVRFTLVGDGQARRAMVTRARKLGLTTLRFVHEWQPAPALASWIHRSDICLGIFGAGPKAESVIPLKAVAALAVGRALVTGDTPAARELLVHGENAWLVPPADPAALAAAIRTLAGRRELREALGARGRRIYLAHLSPPALGHALRGVLEALVAERRGALAVV